MDSKLKRKTISICVMFLFIIFGVVFIIDYKNKTDALVTSKQKEIPLPETTFTPNLDGNISQSGNLKDFLRDETFFDEPIEKEEIYIDETTRLDLSVTSVFKDMRIQVLDHEGTLVTGESFFINLEGVGSYKDVDKDGVIYIGDLSPGEYFVSVEKIEGYRTPVAPLKVKVKETIEYSIISDIDLLVKTEDEIDLEIEDVTAHNVSEDTDETQNSEYIPTDEITSFGIDVSSWNKEIDWEEAKVAGVDFAIIRCGFRGYTSGQLVEDKYFLKNIQGANDAGIQVGLYFFTQATNEIEAVEEASMVLSLCKDENVSYPIFIDTEGVGGNGRADNLDVETRTKVCKAFCETIENAGYRTGIYASKNWLNNKLNMSQLSKYYTWLAEYKAEPTYEGEYLMWQYSSNGWINGISGRVDMNLSYY